MSQRTGGRVNSLSAVPGGPDYYFAATEVGGLFKYDAGIDRWSHLDGFLPSVTWDVKAAPGGQTVFATAPYDGRVGRRAGFQVSFDGGSTWAEPSGTTVEPPENCHPVRAAQPSGFGIALRPGSDEVLVGTNCGLARSTDGGKSWVRFDPVPLPTLTPKPLPALTPLPFPGTELAKTPPGSGLPAVPDALLPPIDAARTVWDVVALPGGETYACGDDGLLWSPNGQSGTWKVLPKPDPHAADPPLPYSPPVLHGYCSLAVSPDEHNVIVAMFGEAHTFDGVGSYDGGRFFEGEVGFEPSGLAGHVEWSAIPHPDQYQGDGAIKRMPLVVINDRKAIDLRDGEGPQDGFDLWLGGGTLVRIPCITARRPRCSTDTREWSPHPALSFTDDGPDVVLTPHGDSGDLVFDPTARLDACPTFYASDGGVYRQVERHPSRCHDQPRFEAANAGLHAFMMWGMGAAESHVEPQADPFWKTFRKTRVGLYMALQDNGLYFTANAAVPPLPKWVKTGGGADTFDAVGDASGVLVNDYGFRTGHADLANIQDVGSGELSGKISPRWLPREAIAQAAPERYWILSRGFTGDVGREGSPRASPPVARRAPLPAVPRGVLDLRAGGPGFLQPWFDHKAPVGTVPPYQGPPLLGGVPWPDTAQPPCHIQVSKGRDGPQPYVLAGNDGEACDFASANQLWTFEGGQWRQLQPPGLGAGFSMFGVDPQHADRLYAAVLRPPPATGAAATPLQPVERCCGEAIMHRSLDGGRMWDPDEELTDLMHGRGRFVQISHNPGDGMLPTPQPTVVAFSGSLVVAGGRESGIFLSNDGGDSWALLTDPFNPTVEVPHLPRPFFIRVQGSPGQPAPDLYVGSLGRGVWRINLTNAELSLSVSNTPDPVKAGAELSYVVGLDNSGPDVAHHVELEDNLPPGTTFKSVEAPPGWSCSPPGGAGKPLRCHTRDMAPAGGCCVFTVRVSVDPTTPPGTVLSNTARVVSASRETNVSNNQSTVTTAVIAQG